MTTERLDELARDQWGGHDALVDAGYALAGKSGFWRTANGTITGRLVYRQRDSRDAGVSTIAVTIRGIPLQYA